jgi:hypothetical protein
MATGEGPGPPLEEPLPPGGTPVGEDAPWDAWHPREAAARLAGVDVPWAVAGGWALDLSRGEQTREHSDLEIAIPAAGFGAVQAALDGFEILIAGSGHLWPLGNAAALAAETQTWVREPATGLFRLDIFREPHDGSTWICRRDTSIRRPYRDVIGVTADGVPFLVPEIVLLFKAKHRRPKDEADFTGTLPLLDPAQRSWLASALAIVHPGHPWLSQCPP